MLQKSPTVTSRGPNSSMMNIKTGYEIPDLYQWYDGKIVARSDAAMMNKRILFELKKYNERMREIYSTTF